MGYQIPVDPYPPNTDFITIFSESSFMLRVKTKKTFIETKLGLAAKIVVQPCKNNYQFISGISSLTELCSTIAALQPSAHNNRNLCSFRTTFLPYVTPKQYYDCCGTSLQPRASPWQH